MKTLPLENKQTAPEVITTKPKEPLGQLLKRAGLINQAQLDLALQNQAISGYEDLKLGEILSLRGWVRQETSDFFAARWEQVKAAARIGQFKRKLGDYLYEAHLLNAEQIMDILEYQRKNKILFGHIAVSKGYIKQETLNFFIENLLTVAQKKTTVDFYIERAQQYLAKNDKQGAILELREALQFEPNNAKCHALLAKTYAQQHQMGLAKVHFKKASQVNPKDTIIQELNAQKIFSINTVQQLSTTASQPAKPTRKLLNLF